MPDIEDPTTTETINIEKIDSKLLTIHNALLDTNFIPEVTEMDSDKIKSIKYCLRK